MTKKELDAVREKLKEHMTSDECDDTMRKVLEIMTSGDDELLAFGVKALRLRMENPKVFEETFRQIVREV